MNSISTLDLFRHALHRQFRASLQMLRQNMVDCPDELWERPMWKEVAADSRLSQFWYVNYHCLFFSDLYLSGSDFDFSPPAPFNLDELDPVGVVPDPSYSRDLLLEYLGFIEEKCDILLLTANTAKFSRKCVFSWGFNIQYAELVIDTIRHIQEHGSQCSMFLGQQKNYSQKWTTTVD